jgi:uncharacterized protein
VLLAVAACSSSVSGTPAADQGAAGTAETFSTRSSGTSSTATSTAASTDDTRTTVTDPTEFASGVTLEEFESDLKDAQTIVDAYWATHWSDFYTGTYTPPSVIGLYDGTDPSTAPTCDGEPLEAYNAFYCPFEDYVAWDVNLMAAGTDLIGDTWIYLVIAHEWAHAIQNRLDLGLVANGRELQADCLAAATLFGAAAAGALDIEEGDEKEMVNSLSLLADEMAWTMSSDHGDPFQRVQWFTEGRNGGVLACHEPLADSTVETTAGSGTVEVTGTPTAPSGVEPVPETAETTG